MLCVFSSQVLAEIVIHFFAKFALKISFGDTLGEIFSVRTSSLEFVMSFSPGLKGEMLSVFVF